MLKLYRKSQEVQLNWIRNHPVQYVALNATLIAVYVGYTMYKDRQEKRQLETEIAQKTN